MGKWILVGALGLCACSSSSGNTEATGGQGSAGTSSGNASGTSASAGASNMGGTASGGSSNGGSSGTGGAAAGSGSFVTTAVNDPSKMRGSVYLNQSTSDRVSFSYDFDVIFDSERAEWDGCTKNQLGACWYYDCPAGSNPVGEPAAEATPPEDAGTVTLSGSPNNLQIIGGFGNYKQDGSAQLWPLVGGTLTLALSGSSSVPAFTMQVPVPPHIFLTTINGQPQMMNGTFKRSEGIRLAWTTSGPGTAFFSVYEFSGTRPAAICQFDASAGQGELPAAVLEQLDPGASYYSVLRGDARGQVMNGPWLVESYAYAFGSQGEAASITLE